MLSGLFGLFCVCHFISYGQTLPIHPYLSIIWPQLQHPPCPPCLLCIPCPVKPVRTTAVSLAKTLPEYPSAAIKPASQALQSTHSLLSLSDFLAVPPFARHFCPSQHRLPAALLRPTTGHRPLTTNHRPLCCAVLFSSLLFSPLLLSTSHGMLLALHLCDKICLRPGASSGCRHEELRTDCIRNLEGTLTDQSGRQPDGSPD